MMVFAWIFQTVYFFPEWPARLFLFYSKYVFKLIFYILKSSELYSTVLFRRCTSSWHSSYCRSSRFQRSSVQFLEVFKTKRVYFALLVQSLSAIIITFELTPQKSIRKTDSGYSTNNLCCKSNYKLLYLN